METTGHRLHFLQDSDRVLSPETLDSETTTVPDPGSISADPPSSLCLSDQRAADRRIHVPIMVVSVEDVSSSLVREYLSRKGLKRTMACMDEEHPRTEASINNRSPLRQILNMEALYKKNKVQGSPLKTLLEIIVKHHIEGSGRDETSSDGRGPPQSDGPAVTELAAKSGGGCDLRSGLGERCPSEPKAGRLSARQAALWAPEGQSLGADLQDSEGSIRQEPEIKTPRTKSTHRTRTNQMRRGMMTGPIASRPTPQDSNRKRPSQRVEGPQLVTEEENTREGPPLTDLHPKRDVAQVGSADCTGGSRGWRSRARRENSFGEVGPDCPEAETCPAASGLSEMVLDDVDDDDDLRDLSKVSFERTVAEPSCRGRPMDQHSAAELKTLLLGSSLNCFSVEWRNQGFTFSETHELRYGIVQKKGGPCGVLASIQAFVLKNLLFEKVGGLQRLRPSSTCRRECLVLAAAEILWRAGEEKQATLAVNSGRNHFTPAGHYKSEGVFEKITCFTVDSVKDLQSLVEQHIEQFETGALGCVLLTISAVLSRSVEKVREDMDVPTTTLVGAHGYCTQELVNLFLCGRAVSNVFDDDMELDSGNANVTLLKGIKGHCDIGLLSLFEHYNICKVGAYLKTPRYPIWVVCSESHFSVLFGLQRGLLTSVDTDLEFDLYYYDGLANQQEEIRLTVSVGKLATRCQDVDTDLIPPLEHCIRTRWKDAVISWNDTEPIL